MILDKIKYCFESDSYCLFEIKLNIENEPDKYKLYHWLLFDKYNQTLQELDFVSMSDNSRVFKQGRLVFDNENSTLLFDNVLFLRVLPNKMNNTLNYILTNFT